MNEFFLLEMNTKAIIELQRQKIIIEDELRLKKIAFSSGNTVLIIGIVFLTIFSLVFFAAVITVPMERYSDKSMIFTYAVMAISGVVGFVSLFKFRLNREQSYEDVMLYLKNKIGTLDAEILKKENEKISLNRESIIVGIGKNRDLGVETDKICPMCAEKVKSAAKICRFCRHRFEE